LLTGRENAITAGILAGFRRADVLSSLDGIAAFAELEDVFDHPVRTYSDGMRIRLAFAVAVSADPDALVIDEVLSVGDLRFQEKCSDRLEELQAGGTTILLASHEEALVRRLCSRVVWIDGGRVQAHGEPDEVLETYAGAMRAETERRVAAAGGEADSDDADRVGTLEVEIADVRIVPLGAREGEEGMSVRLEIDLAPRVPVDEPIVSVSLHRVGDYARMLDVSTEGDGTALGRLDAPQTVVLELGGMVLPSGSYRFDVGVFEKGWGYIYDYRWHAYPFEVGEDGHDGARSRWSVL
jgi:lipopolysaccharide transport system ATP-binding protein